MNSLLLLVEEEEGIKDCVEKLLVICINEFEDSFGMREKENESLFVNEGIGEREIVVEKREKKEKIGRIIFDERL